MFRRYSELRGSHPRNIFQDTIFGVVAILFNGSRNSVPWFSHRITNFSENGFVIHIYVHVCILYIHHTYAISRHSAELHYLLTRALRLFSYVTVYLCFCLTLLVQMASFKWRGSFQLSRYSSVHCATLWHIELISRHSCTKLHHLRRCAIYVIYVDRNLSFWKCMFSSYPIWSNQYVLLV